MGGDDAHDPVEVAHETMRTHLPSGHWCGNSDCGERWPCMRRRDARSLLIRVGHLVLPDAATGRRP